MESTVKTYTYPDGTMQRVQLVRPDSWEQLQFLNLRRSEGALDCFAAILRQYLIPACPWIFGNLVLFQIPRGLKIPFSRQTKYGAVADDLTAAAAALKQNVSIANGRPRFRCEEAKRFWEALEQQGCIRLVKGKLPTTQFIPVGDAPGFLTAAEPGAALKVNASFFIMDPIDCATVYDHVGTCLGLMVKNGTVLNPPLYSREALLVRKNGTVSIEEPDIRRTDIVIGGTVYRHGKNAILYTRPERLRTPGGTGKKLIIIGCRVAAVVERGSAAIPASGFVLCPEGECAAKPGDAVSYPGMEDVVFGIQVGNSIVRDGVKTDRFRSRFYNIRHLEPVPFPPSLYPMNFKAGRAARIALGADKNGKPMLLWAEGAPKLGYLPGTHSRGASLADMADICADLGMVNAVNLDGGGSAQLLLGDRRTLEISDRNPDCSQSERPVPNALYIP